MNLLPPLFSVLTLLADGCFPRIYFDDIDRRIPELSGKVKECCKFPVLSNGLNPTIPLQENWKNCENIRLTCEISSVYKEIAEVSVLANYTNLHFSKYKKYKLATSHQQVSVTVHCNRDTKLWFVVGGNRSNEYKKFTCLWMMDSGLYFPSFFE
ncbi:hypothetical protein CRE_26719 [Caenorhabditis remanei]|uniref:Uncharacterized protein n=1 Tax=Caenorhabditis remanei TaxID=31234 RepID=E3MXU7_CAERE|nr:hypothetical protein CRE_26719 [Caenorhabditis remanei]